MAKKAASASFAATGVRCSDPSGTGGKWAGSMRGLPGLLDPDLAGLAERERVGVLGEAVQPTPPSTSISVGARGVTRCGRAFTSPHSASHADSRAAQLA